MHTSDEQTWAARECERQGEGPEMIPHFLAAWTYARSQFFPYNKEDLDLQIRVVNELVCNRPGTTHRITKRCIGTQGYRKTPVIFANGNEGTNWMAIRRLMAQLADSDLLWTDPEAFVIEFLRIHPFEDGNGRTASILLNRRTAKDLFVDLPQIEGWINEAS